MHSELLLLVHAGATLAMTGLIWFVQVVHYPLFRFADRVEFAAFAGAHQRRTTWVVAPLMLLEAACATLLLADASGPGAWAVWTGWTALALIWGLTAAVLVPLHRRLGGGFDSRAARRLVRWNWPRTAAWTVRAVLALWLLGAAA